MHVEEVRGQRWDFSTMEQGAAGGNRAPPWLLAATTREPSSATVMERTAVPTSGTSSQLHAFAVRSHTRMLPCWSPARGHSDITCLWPELGGHGQQPSLCLAILEAFGLSRAGMDSSPPRLRPFYCTWSGRTQ